MRSISEFGQEDLHLWLIDLDGPQAQSASERKLLSPDECSRASSMRREVVRTRFVAARSVLRDLAGHYCGVPATKLVFRYLDKGKPEIDADAECGHSTIEFNLSHSDRYALLGFSRCGRIGVDIEKHSDRVNVDAIASSYLSDHESEQLSRFTDSSRRRWHFFRAWVLKEAFMKCTGLGFSLPLDKFSVDLVDDQHPSLVWLNAQYAEFNACQFGHVPVPEGFSGAWAILATDVEQTEFTMKCFEYDAATLSRLCL